MTGHDQRHPAQPRQREKDRGARAFARRFGLRLGAGALALVAGASGTGCGADFAPYNRVTGLRILGIQSEPAAPLSGETATFTALVVTPSAAPAPPLTYQWTWCPLAGLPEKGYKCLVDGQQIDIDALLASAVPPLPPLPSFDLGTAPTATFANDIPPEVFAAVCNGRLSGLSTEFPIDCSAGFPIQIMLTVSSDTDALTAVQTVKLRFDQSMPANANPTIAGLTATVGEMNTLMPVPIVASAADGDLVTLRRDVETPVQVDMVETEAEVYAGKDDDDKPATLTERLFLTWFIETGETHDSRTSFFSGSTDFSAMLKNRWTPGLVKDYPQDTARIFVVAHDNRGGVSWRTGTVTLGPPP